ncbi:hypothetical protein C9374_008722 [Naegleria lovaniensis]|uniref:Uncharacterized protein n=1 Tax=Naegleria lovaniensis TaxID=51637 RepID=A0AA88KFU8_NAELO|nr:uncharacterized protein C9374_008722 [Naegleria lovaniensis]KAG2378100.1 hypothetical protein C9374_008722 [Naegleria lovaniensis]
MKNHKTLQTVFKLSTTPVTRYQQSSRTSFFLNQSCKYHHSLSFNSALTVQDWKALFISYFYRGILNSSVEDFSKAAEIQPLNSRVYFNRGLSYYNQGLNDQALQDFNTSLSLDPTLIECLWLRGKLYLFEKHDNLKSIADFEKILELNPEFYAQAQIYVHLGELYKDLDAKDEEERIQNWNKAISYFVKSIDHIMKVEQEEVRLSKLMLVYYSLTELYMNMEMYDKALYACSQFIKYCPKTYSKKELATMYCSRGTILSEYFQTYDLAITDFLKAVKLDPELEEPYVFLSKAYYNKTDMQNVYKYAKQAEEIIEQKGSEYKLTIDPMMLNTMYEMLGFSYEAKEEYELAIKYFENGLKYGDYEYHVFEALAFSYSRAKKEFDKGIQLFTQRIEQAQNGTVSEKSFVREENRLTVMRAYLLRACVYIFAEQYESAIQDIDVILEKEPENALAIITRGEAIFKMTGNLELAQPYFDKGLRLFPEAKTEIENMINDVMTKRKEQKKDEN